MSETTKIDEITNRIYQKSDQELHTKLEASIAWVWNESGHSVQRPDPSRLTEVQSALNGTGLGDLKGIPWIGSSNKFFVEVAFCYLRDKYRSQAIYDFMQKVESISEIGSQQESQ